MKKIIVNFRKTLLKCYWDFYKSTKTYIYIITGRSAGKTTAVPDKLLYDFLKYPEGNVIVIRKNQNTLARSAFMAIQRAIYKIGMEDDFEFVPSRLIIEDKLNGSRFYFFGMDDENKIRSTVMKYGEPFRYWIEEYQEFDSIQDLMQIEDLLDTFIREKLPKGLFHQAIHTGNRPRNPYTPLNIHIDKLKEANDPDVVFYNPNYLNMVDNDTGENLLSEQQMIRINRTKERDLNAFKHRYLGIAIGDDKQVYDMKNVKVIETLEGEEIILGYDIVIDTGYQVSATTFQAWAYTSKRNALLLGTYYFSPDVDIVKRIPADVLYGHKMARNQTEKKSPSQFVTELIKFEKEINLAYGLSCDDKFVDSAEGGLRNEYFEKTGDFLRPVHKLGKDEMIEISRDVQIEREVYVFNVQSNKIFLFEMSKYSRDEKGRIIKEDDHTTDTYQYWCVMARDKLGLR